MIEQELLARSPEEVVDLAMLMAVVESHPNASAIMADVLGDKVPTREVVLKVRAVVRQHLIDQLTQAREARTRYAS